MLQDLTVWEAFERIAQECGSRPFIITPSGESTFREVYERAGRFAGYLHAARMGRHADRCDLANWQSGQDHLGIYLGNGVPYVEAMLGALRASVVPTNINYRYVAGELRDLLRAARTTGIVYDAAFASTLTEALAGQPPPKVLVQVDGDHPLVPGAVMFEDAIQSGPKPSPDLVPLSDDLFIVCTGGTTGLPKAVLWRQADFVASLIGGRHPVTSQPVDCLDDLIAGAKSSEMRALMGPPLMHLTGFGLVLLFAMSGGTLVLADPPLGMDAPSIWKMVERARVNMLVVVGDAFGRPLLEDLRKNRYETPDLRVVVNGAASMAPEVKRALAEALGGGVQVIDAIGSSESGVLARNVRAKEQRPGVFRPTATTGIVAPDLSRFLDPDDDTVGWLAGYGRLPLGYLDHPEKTAATFPTIDGRRCTVPGDRTRWLEDGSIQLMGRDATTINTGGEKVFSDEVEQALRKHSDVAEALVVGRPSERWGQEVVALVTLEAGRDFDPRSVLEECGLHLSRYKLPKELIVVERIERTAVGKPDYAWARERAAGSTTQGGA